MTDIVGIVAIVKDELKNEILKLWSIAEKKYNSKDVQSFDHPNLGFQGGQCENISSLKRDMLDLSSTIAPFEIVVNGFGYFEHPTNVIYLKVIKTEKLKRLHKNINDLLSEHCSNIFEFYTPENWIPHITVAMNDLTNENFKHFKENLVEQTPFFTHKVSYLQLVKFCENGRIELVENFMCGGIN